MKSKFLKIAGVKTEAEFYNKYPSEAAFFKAHPEARDLKKLKAGGLTGKPGVYSDGYSGTSSAGVYYDLGGSYIFNPMFAESGVLPKYGKGAVKYGNGGHFDDQDFNDFATMMMTIGSAFPGENKETKQSSITKTSETPAAKHGGKVGHSKPLRKFQTTGQFNTNTSVTGFPATPMTGMSATSNPYMWGNLPPLGQEPTYQPSAKDIGMQGIPITATSSSTPPQISSSGKKNTIGKLANVSGAVGTFLDNRQKRKQAKEKTALDSLADNRTPIMPIGVSGQRGDYDQFGIFRPDEYVVNKGMYTSNTPGLQLKQFGGGLIAEVNDVPLEEVTMAPPISSEPSTRPGSSSGDKPMSSGANPIAEQTWNDISSDFKGVKNLGIWGDKKHQKTKSDHNTGDALDIGIVDLDQGSKIAQRLFQEANDRNIKYIIFNKQIWNPSVSNEWRPYKGDNPHSSHVHVSFNRNPQDLGQISLTHNNPLNIHHGKFAEGYGGRQGSKDGGGNVSIFPDLTTGIQAAKDLLFGPNYSNLTISQARNKWVSGNPSTLNNSTNYIVKEMGEDKKLSDLNTAEREKLIKQFAKWEGKQSYNKIKDMPLFSNGGNVPSYKDGGVYELTEEEIRDILSRGGNVEFI
jgi:hypothetical protein